MSSASVSPVTSLASYLPFPARPVRVAVINDFEVIVAGVAMMLAPYDDRVEVVDLDDQTPVATEVDILLSDTSACSSGDNNRVRDLVRDGGPKVVVYTWSTDRTSADRAVASGASGYLSKKLPPLDLVRAIEDIQAGAIITCDRDGGPLAQEPGTSSGRGLDLSPRQAEVLSLIATGRSNKEIAELIYLSVNSVKTYIRTAYARIGVTSRSQAVLWALQHDLVPEARDELSARRSLTRFQAG